MARNQIDYTGVEIEPAGKYPVPDPELPPPHTTGNKQLPWRRMKKGESFFVDEARAKHLRTTIFKINAYWGAEDPPKGPRKFTYEVVEGGYRVFRVY